MENNENNTGVETVETNEEGKTTFTKEEVLALIQSESDRRVSQALKTERKKYEKQLSLSKLDGEERFVEQHKKMVYKKTNIIKTL